MLIEALVQGIWGHETPCSSRHCCRVSESMKHHAHRCIVVGYPRHTMLIEALVQGIREHGPPCSSRHCCRYPRACMTMLIKALVRGIREHVSACSWKHWCRVSESMYHHAHRGIGAGYPRACIAMRMEALSQGFREHDTLFLVVVAWLCQLIHVLQQCNSEQEECRSVDASTTSTSS